MRSNTDILAALEVAEAHLAEAEKALKHLDINEAARMLARSEDVVRKCQGVRDTLHRLKSRYVQCLISAVKPIISEGERALTTREQDIVLHPNGHLEMRVTFKGLQRGSAEQIANPYYRESYSEFCRAALARICQYVERQPTFLAAEIASLHSACKDALRLKGNIPE